MSETETVWEGRFISVRKQGTWEYAVRARQIRAVVVVAIDDDGHLLLVEQRRVPLTSRCLELPAGLVGDDLDGDTPELAAARELEEECGYRPDTVELLGEFAFSPGMTNETFSLARATGLTRVSDGGGAAGEEITVHRVPMSGLRDFVAERRAEGVQVAAPMLAVLGALLLA